MKTWLSDPAIGRPCTIIGEVAQAHDGSLGMAHAFIDAIAAAGATAVKFQTHIAAAESSLQEPWRKKFSPQDETRYDYWRRMEFTESQWEGLRRHAESKDLLFLSSPFSMEAAEMLMRVGVAGWKIASGEISNGILLDRLCATGQPIILSTGMSPLAEIDEAVARIQSHQAPLAVLQCASAYPCPPELVGLNVMEDYRHRYQTAVGLSDHSAKIFPGLAAATLGAEVLEVHVTLSREMFGPDVVASLTSGELAQLVEGVRFIEKMRTHPVDKSTLDQNVAGLRNIFMKSIVAYRDIPKGTVLTPADLTSRKPGTGIPAAEIEAIIGRCAANFIPKDSFLRLEDLDPPVP